MVREQRLAVGGDGETLRRGVARDELRPGRDARRHCGRDDERRERERGAQEPARARRIPSVPVSASDPDLERFLLTLQARRSPRTVDAYRRDLRALGGFREGAVADTTVEELEAWLAAMRADGLASSTIARRVSAVRTYFRHLVLIGARAENPAASVQLPRRARTLPRALSPAETERLIDAAIGTTPRALRDRALVELLYGAGLRVSEATGLEKGSVAIEERIVRVLGKGGKERLVPLGRPAAEAVRRYLALGRPHLDRRYRPELFLNARGGALTRAGAFLILRKLADRAGPRAGSRPSPPPPPLVRDASPRRRRRPTLGAGDARARRPRDDGALHARLRPPATRRVLPGTPARTAPHAESPNPPPERARRRARARRERLRRPG